MWTNDVIKLVGFCIIILKEWFLTGSYESIDSIHFKLLQKYDPPTYAGQSWPLSLSFVGLFNVNKWRHRSLHASTKSVNLSWRCVDLIILNKLIFCYEFEQNSIKTFQEAILVQIFSILKQREKEKTSSSFLFSGVT